MGRKGSTVSWAGALLFRKNVFLDRFRPFGCHFSAFRAESKNRTIFDVLTILDYFGPFGALFGPFWTLFGPQNGLRSPKTQLETYQNWAKGVQKAIKNVFWDRFRSFKCHFSAFREESKNRKFFDFLTILGPFWPKVAVMASH